MDTPSNFLSPILFSHLSSPLSPSPSPLLFPLLSAFYPLPHSLLSLVTFPLDVLKTRLQIQGHHQPYSGMWQTGVGIGKCMCMCVCVCCVCVHMCVVSVYMCVICVCTYVYVCAHVCICVCMCVCVLCFMCLLCVLCVCVMCVLCVCYVCAHVCICFMSESLAQLKAKALQACGGGLALVC